jgi:hypothetical protein
LGEVVLLAQSVDQIGGLDQPIILLVVFGAVLTFLSLCGFLGACCAIQRDGHSKIDGCCADRALMIYYVGILTGAPSNLSPAKAHAASLCRNPAGGLTCHVIRTKKFNPSPISSLEVRRGNAENHSVGDNLHDVRTSLSSSRI